MVKIKTHSANSHSILHLADPKVVKKRKRGVTRARVAKMGAVEQMIRAFSRGNWLSAGLGIVLGGFVPIAVYSLVHFEVQTHPWFWIMVVGGLGFSATSVYKWAEQAFHMWVKALGFVLLLEGTVTFATERWLGLTGLSILVLINVISAAVALQAKD